MQKQNVTVTKVEILFNPVHWFLYIGFIFLFYLLLIRLLSF